MCPILSRMSDADSLVVAVLGRGVVAADDLAIPADDLGLTRGDGCFDAMRVVRDATGTRVDHRVAHLARFSRSADLLGLPPVDLDAWTALIDAAVDAWTGTGTVVCRVLWTRGPEGGGPPTGLVLLTPAPDAGVPLRVVTLSTGRASDAFEDAPWLLGGVKTLSYGINAAARREAARRSADDVLFISSDGYLLEGPTSGLLVARNGTLVTTPTRGTGVLASVTVEVIARAALAHGLQVRRRLMVPEEIDVADGAWLVSAVRGVCPIVSLDGRSLTIHPELTARIASWAGFGPDPS